MSTSEHPIKIYQHVRLHLHISPYPAHIVAYLVLHIIPYGRTHRTQWTPVDPVDKSPSLSTSYINDELLMDHFHPFSITIMDNIYIYMCTYTWLYIYIFVHMRRGTEHLWVPMWTKINTTLASTTCRKGGFWEVVLAYGTCVNIYIFHIYIYTYIDLIYLSTYLSIYL